MSQIAFVNRNQTSIRFIPHLGAIPWHHDNLHCAWLALIRRESSNSQHDRPCFDSCVQLSLACLLVFPLLQEDQSFMQREMNQLKTWSVQ